jgi:hypothetical protein
MSGRRLSEGGELGAVHVHVHKTALRAVGIRFGQGSSPPTPAASSRSITTHDQRRPRHLRKQLNRHLYPSVRLPPPTRVLYKTSSDAPAHQLARHSPAPPRASLRRPRRARRRFCRVKEAAACRACYPHTAGLECELERVCVCFLVSRRTSWSACHCRGTPFAT